MPDVFEALDVDAIREIQNKDKEDKIDHEWAQRISTVPIGAGFRLQRTDEESQRNFKRRINSAAAAPPSFRTLDWYPQDTNLPKNVDPKNYVVRVKSIDTKAKSEWEAAQTSQNGTAGTPQAPQTPPESNGTPDTSDEGTEAQRRRR
jgi:hypothetical protein